MGNRIRHFFGAAVAEELPATRASEEKTMKKFQNLRRTKCWNPCRAYCSWTWSAFGLRVVRVTHDVWVRPVCTKRVRFDRLFAGTRVRRRRIQKGQKSEHGFLRRSEAGATRLGHTFLVTKSLQPPSGHHFWTLDEAFTPCRETRLFPILFEGDGHQLIWGTFGSINRSRLPNE